MFSSVIFKSQSSSASCLGDGTKIVTAVLRQVGMKDWHKLRVLAAVSLPKQQLSPTLGQWKIVNLTFNSDGL